MRERLTRHLQPPSRRLQEHSAARRRHMQPHTGNRAATFPCRDIPRWENPEQQVAGATLPALPRRHQLAPRSVPEEQRQLQRVSVRRRPRCPREAPVYPPHSACRAARLSPVRDFRKCRTQGRLPARAFRKSPQLPLSPEQGAPLPNPQVPEPFHRPRRPHRELHQQREPLPLRGLPDPFHGSQQQTWGCLHERLSP